MIKKVIIAIFLLYILYNVFGYLKTQDLETYRTYDIEEGSEFINECINDSLTVYDDYQCVDGYIKIEEFFDPTDDEVVLSLYISKKEETDEINYTIIAPYIDSAWTPWANFDDLSTSMYSIRYLDCEYNTMNGCEPKSHFTENRRNHLLISYADNVEGIFNQTSTITIYDDRLLVFPIDDENTKEYLDILVKGNFNNKEFWKKIEQGINEGNVLVKDLDN